MVEHNLLNLTTCSLPSRQCSVAFCKVRYSVPNEAHPTLFADDLKLFSDDISNNPSSSSHLSSTMLQNAIDSVNTWSQLWQLPISIPKCVILSISNSKSPKPRLYTIDGLTIPQTLSCSDLGVIVVHKLSFSAHVLSITQKAYKKSIIMSRCFLSKNPYLLTRAFSTYVRPILEYASPIWSPHLSKDIDSLEKV